MSTSPSPFSPGRPTPALAGLFDTLLVVVFAVLGARTHHDGALTPRTVADVAWPFLVGLALAYVLLVVLRRAPAALLSGVVVWVSTVAVAMVLRRLTGDGTAVAFVLVATGVTGATLLGWRLVALLLRRSR